MEKRIIVSAANALYYPLLLDLISSIEQKNTGSRIPIGVLDIGLSPDQRSALSARVEHVFTANWDYQILARVTPSQKFQALTARPHLPKYFPGYETIMWMDADTWIQQWAAVNYFFEMALKHGLAICQEMDRCYLNVYNLNNSRRVYFESLAGFGDLIKSEFRDQLITLPLINSGVFAMRFDSPYWFEWSDMLDNGIRRGYLDFCTEQAALNICIYKRQQRPYFLPAKFNWICVHARPMFNRETGLYVEPAVPHDALGIIHLTGMKTRFQNYEITDLQGNKTQMNLTYSQWRQYRESAVNN